jgi:uncharacterized protein YacL
MFFRKKVKTHILDEQTLSDGRVIPLIEKQLFQGKFILIPQAVYEVTPPNALNDETYTKRINENIERIKKIAKTTIIKKQMNKAEFIKLAKKHNAIIITPNDETKSALLTEMSEATMKTVKIIALSELYDILKPDYLPGSEFKVTVTKKGKEYDEGIGYLDGGIKVVVTGGAKAIGRELEVVVLGSIETNVGKLIFTKPKYVEVK